MLPHRFPRPVRLGLYALACAILLVLCVLPSKDLPDPGTGDRFEHTAAWFVLTATGYLLAPDRRLAIPAFALVYGVAIEIFQGLAPTGRHSDPLDFVADSVGVALAVAAYVAVRPVSGGMSLRHAPWEEAGEFRIGLKAIPTEAWFEGGEADPAARKDALLAAHPAEVWAETEGSRPAQAELLELVGEALSRPIAVESRPPLLAAARAVADDLCLMEHRDGAWRLTALSLSAGSFFTASEVIGRSLAELHTPVAGFQERLLARVTRIFDGLRDDLMLERRNWSVVSSPDLFMPDPGPMRAVIHEIDPARAADELFVRCERQTLRRLPETRGVVFTIRVWIDPLSAIAAEPGRLARFAEAWKTAHPDFRAYKKLHLYDDLVARVIDAA